MKPEEKLIDLLQHFPILKYFEYGHLPEHLQSVSKPFAEIAIQMVQQGATTKFETEAGLRKLLEAKDCFVRASLNR